MAVANVVYDIRAGVAKLNQDFARAEKMVGGSMNRIRTIMRRAAIGVAAAVGVNAIRNMALQVTQLGDDLDKMSQRTGVSAEALQGLQYGAEQSGASVDNLQRAMRNLSERIGETSSGIDRFAERYRRFGVELVDGEGNARATEDVFSDVADVLASMEDGAAKTEAAMKMLGVNAGPRLLPMLNQGSEGLRRFHEEARSLGIVMSNESVQALSNFSTNLGRLRSLVAGVGRQIMAGLAQPLEALTDVLFEAAAGQDKYMRIQEAAAAVGEQFLLGVDVMTGYLVNFLDTIFSAIPGIDGFRAAVSWLSEKFEEWDVVLHSVAAVLRTVSSAAQLIALVFRVVGQSIAGVASAVVLAVQGRFREAAEAAGASGEDMLETTRRTLTSLRETWTQSSEEIVETARGAGLGLSGALDRIREGSASTGRQLRALGGDASEAGKASASAARDVERLARAIEDNALQTDILVARSLGQHVQVMRLELHQQIREIDRMLAAGELSAEDHARRREALERETEARITEHYATETEKRRAIREREYEEMERERAEAQRVGIGIAEAFTRGFRGVFESADFKSLIRGLLGTFSRVASLIPGGQMVGAGAGIFAGLFAEGGLIQGPGTSTSDSILARVSDGEYVSTAAAVRSFGEDFFDRLNQGVIDLSTLPRYAAGGVVGTAPARAMAAPVGHQAPIVYVQAFDPRSTEEAMGRVFGPAQYRRSISRQDSQVVAGMRRRVLPPRSGR